MSECEKALNIIEDIKSLYIIKKVFSFLNEKQKLNIIIYNKQLQNIFGVNIDDYKKISGKYRIIENGYGKEYELGTNRLIFEGEYINGKRNGIGKEFDDGKLKFEGEYSNGERNGNGKEYDYHNQLIYDGKYLNGERWNGEVKDYYYNDKLKFEGEYFNGKIWNGKGYNNDGDLEFELINGKGKVKEYDYDGKLKFEGE